MRRAVAAWSLWAFNNLESNGSAIWLNGKKQAWKNMAEMACHTCIVRKTHIYIH
jgi:hypothetical protein